jgi:hypothetical protein
MLWRQVIRKKERSMRHLVVLVALLALLAGCNGNDDPKDAKDAGPVYEAVLKVELKNSKKGEGWSVFIDGKDPEPEMLKRFQKQWPELQPGSKAPKGRADRVSLSELKWIDRSTAELRGGFSNGIDGRGSLYRVVRKKDAWVVESSKVEVES